MIMAARRFAIFIFVLLILGTTAVWGQVTHRPVMDFVNAQVTTGAWINSATPNFAGVVDYGGVAQRWMMDTCGIDIGAAYTGDITETAMGPGKTQVHVVLHGKNVFMRAFLWADGTPVLGYTKAEVCYQGATPMLGDVTLTADFINNQDPGGPLPDALLLSNDPAVLPYMQSVLLNATGQAPVRFLFETPVGTPAFLRVLQRGVFPQGKGVPAKDYFPAEVVMVKPAL